MKIFQQIPKIMGDLNAIGKNQQNDAQRYKYRGIEDIYNAIHPLLVKHSVFCVPQVIECVTSEFEGTNQRGDRKITFRVLLRVNHKFFADDGSCVEVITQGEGLDTSDKASNKAMSAAMKYACNELFFIPTVDIVDSDKESPEVVGNSKASRIQKELAPASDEALEKFFEVPAPKPGEFTITKPSGPLADFVIKVGNRYKGKTLKEVAPGDLKDFCMYMENLFKEKGQVPTGDWAETLNSIREFLGQKAS